MALHLLLITAFTSCVSALRANVAEGTTGNLSAAADVRNRALNLAVGLASCSYNVSTGTWPGELLWQSGNTLETLASLSIELGEATSPFENLFANTFALTPIVVDNCFDDHQWWLLGWIRVYEATGNVTYLERAAAVHDFIVSNGWDTSLCGGGVLWCPTPTNPYKNAVTTELFFTASARLHPYTALLGRAPGHFLGWAKTAWQWFADSGMVNAQSLVNDGLTGTCTNNGQTVWSYNQGVLLDGSAILSNATGDSSILAAGASIALAAIAALANGNGVMTEPCGSNCALNHDAWMFKGIFVRHAADLLSSGALAPAQSSKLAAFLVSNLDAMLTNGSCAGVPTGYAPYGLAWDGPCVHNGTATASAALDLMVAVLAASNAGAVTERSHAGKVGPAIALGACVDSEGVQMPSCTVGGATEAACAAAAALDVAALAYDFTAACDGSTTCNVRTTGGAKACPAGWTFTPGLATMVATGDGTPLTLCVART